MDHNENEYDFRPEFDSKAEALADYGGLEDDFQLATVQSQAGKRGERKIQNSGDSSDEAEGEGDEDKEAARTHIKGIGGGKTELSKNVLRVRKRMMGLARLGAPRVKAHVAAISRRVLSNPEEALEAKYNKGE